MASSNVTGVSTGFGSLRAPVSPTPVSPTTVPNYPLASSKLTGASNGASNGFSNTNGNETQFYGRELGALRTALTSDFRIFLGEALERHEAKMRGFILESVGPPQWSADASVPVVAAEQNGDASQVADHPSHASGLWVGMSIDDVPGQVDKHAHDYEIKQGTFDMKGGNKSNREDAVYDVRNFYKTSGVCQRIARSNPFVDVTLGVISANAVWLGVDTEFNKATSLLQAEWPYIIGDQFFCFYFTAEVFLRFGAFQDKFNCLKDRWFIFDTCLVTLMIFESWVMPIFLLATGAESAGLPTAPLRLLRLLRLSRLVRLMRSLPELVTMVKGMKVASRAVASSLLMVFMLIYVFAIILHMLLSKQEGFEDQFGRLHFCMFTLLMDGTFMDNTGSLLHDLLWTNAANTSIAAFIILTFILLSAMTVMNMLIGVLCEVVSAVAESERELQALNVVKETILMELKAFDLDNSGTIAQEELANVLNSPHAVGVLKSLDVDVALLRDMQFRLFPHKDSEVTIESIIDLILLYRGNQQSTVKHLVETQAFTRWFLATGLRTMNERFEIKLDHVQRELASMMRSLAMSNKFQPGDLDMVQLQVEPKPPKPWPQHALT